MCGLSGWYLEPGRTADPRNLQAMADALDHRGPDDRGYHHDPDRGIALASNRLSIIDLSPRGHQPMTGRDGATTLLFNGEIYNFRELRRELESAGHRFDSNSDTEVLLRSWEQWGEQCLDRLYGMFALAVWSPGTETLFLARDAMGIKPLYYTSVPGGGGFVFASELKAFLALADFRAVANDRAIGQFLEFGFTWDEHETALKGVFKLPPGHTLRVRRGRAESPQRFFRTPVSDPEDTRPLDERSDELYRVLTNVVEQHLIADVPAGLLLSGGIDSSLIAAIAAKKARLKTLTMSFADSDIDEREFARTVSRHIGSDHTEIVVPAVQIFSTIEEAVWTVDDLFGDWGVVTTRLLYEKCREAGLKVVLVGEGADELFGGYASFERSAGARATPLRIFDLYRRYAGRRYGRGFFGFNALMQRYLRQVKGDLFDAVRLFETRNQLPNNYVMKVDKASMSVSVEARTPYLDRRVAELAYRTPQEFLMSGTTSKLLLRRMAERYKLLPEAVLQRPKFGAAIASSWMDRSLEFRRFARGVILAEKSWTDTLGYRPAMMEFFDRQKSGYPFPRAISIFRNLAWRLLLLNLWSKKYLKR